MQRSRRAELTGSPLVEQGVPQETSSGWGLQAQLVLAVLAPWGITCATCDDGGEAWI